MSDLGSIRRQAVHGVTRHRNRPLFLETRGSVWNSTKAPIAAFSIYAFGIWLLNNMDLAPNFGRGASSLSSVLSMIVGLMISYRSGSSSDRWHEGRKIWASLTSSTRVLLNTLSLSLPPPSLSDADRLRQQEGVDDLLSLIIAFSYAFKHHLRDSDSLDDNEFRTLLPKRLLMSFENTPERLRTLDPARSMEPEKYQRVLNDHEGTRVRKISGATKLGGPRNMPLLILRQIQSMLNEFHTTLAPAKGSPGSDTVLLETPTWATCLGILKEMTDQLSQAERIRDTPIPMALGIHVQQMLVLYCLSIPPQLVGLLGLWVVPVSAVVAWTFFGVDSAAAQLSDPFGTDVNDLPTDKFVANIHNEFLEIVGRGDTSGSSANDAMLGLPSGIGEKAKGF